MTKKTTTIHRSILKTCTSSDDLSGSVEVFVQPLSTLPSASPSSEQHHDNNSNNKKQSKPGKQISNMIRRMKPPTMRRNKSHTSNSNSNKNTRMPLGEIRLRKAQSAIVTPRSRVRHVRSTSESDLSSYNNKESSSAFVCNDNDFTKENSNHHPTRLLASDASHGDSFDQSDILLVSSSVSAGEDHNSTSYQQPRPNSDFMGPTTSSNTQQSLYNIITSSWRIEDGSDKENKSPTTSTKNNDRSLLRKESTLNLDDTPATATSDDYFFKEDFDSTVWTDVNTTNRISILGAAVMTATVVIHPLVFVAGAATAVWAVGVLHGVEKGYEFFSDGSFSDLFWADSDEEHKDVLEHKKEDLTPLKPCKAKDLKINTATENTNDLSTTPRLNSPVSAMLKSSPPNRKHLTSEDDVIKNFFPDLEHRIVTDVKFPGLNALEFFEVYFADDAPYSYKEFQLTKGDIDIEHTLWNRQSSDLEKQSFHPKANQNGLMKFPTSSKKERELNFKTLTKSYFGPAYATARKTQRVTKFSTRLVILESKTELFDIPFCDRFFVVERWVVESQKHDQSPSTSPSFECPLYTTKLSVYVEVFMLKSCNWERQIREKTLSTVTDLLKDWTKKATAGLDLATRKKMARRKIGSNDDGTSIKSYRSSITNLNKSPNQEAALKMHHRKLKVIEEKIFNGDMDWCNIEIRHSEKAGANNAFAEIIDQYECSDCPREVSIPLTDKLRKKKTLRLFRSRRSIS